MGHSNFDPVDTGPAWNAGRKLGAKRPLKRKEIWAVRVMLDQDRKLRDHALFDLAIDSKLRGCDLVKVKIGDLVCGGRIRNRAMVIRQKTEPSKSVKVTKVTQFVGFLGGLCKLKKLRANR